MPNRAPISAGQSRTLTTTLHLARRREDPRPTLLTTQRRTATCFMLFVVTKAVTRCQHPSPIQIFRDSRIVVPSANRRVIVFRSEQAAAALKTDVRGAATFSASSPLTRAELPPPRATHRSHFRCRAPPSIVGHPP